MKYISTKQLEIWRKACAQGDIEQVQRLEKITEYQKVLPVFFNKEIGIHMINMTSIYSAIESDNPTILNYFLKNPLYNKYIFQEIVHIEEIFSLSTNRKAHFIIDFLFDNDLMNGFSNTHLITLMVLENKNETFKHIYSHPKCSLDLTYDNYKLLKYMCSQDAYDLIDYYLNEKKVKLNDTIINWLKGNNELDTDYYKEIEKIQLYNKLNHTDEHLKNNPLKNKL